MCRAISNLIEWLGKENKFRMSSEHRMLSITSDELQKHPIVFMHGRGELRLSDAQRSALRTHSRTVASCSRTQFVPMNSLRPPFVNGSHSWNGTASAIEEPRTATEHVLGV